MTNTAIVSGATSFMAPRKVQAPALRAGHVVRFFEYLTVPQNKLEAWQRRQTDEAASWAVQWRCEYLPAAQPWIPSPRERCAIAVLEKIIHRGRVTMLSPWLETQIGEGTAASKQAPDRLTGLAHVDATAPDSESEKSFWEIQLPDLMGSDCWRWVTPQVGMECLGVPDSARGEERVDFMVVHPSLPNPLVIEIDGDHHTEAVRRAKDVARDQRLRKAGIQIVRVPAGEIGGSGAALEELRQLLAPVRERPVPARFFSNPYRRAGQIQLALLEALRAGLTDPASLQAARIDIDAVSAGDLTAAQFAATMDDFRGLLARVGQLYGLDWDTAAGAPAHTSGREPERGLVISFYGDQVASDMIHVNDVVLPGAPRV